MKKRILIFILLFLSLLIIFLLIAEENNFFSKISGKAIKSSGKATSNFGISVTVGAGTLPNLTIITPVNQTYIHQEYLELKVQTIYTTNVFFNLDKGTNISASSNGNINEYKKYFNSTLESHTIYVFANNSNGTTQGSVNFSINNDLFQVNFSEFYNFEDEDDPTTNLRALSYQELQNITGFTIQKKDFGKIIFNHLINLTNVSGTFIDLNRHINLSRAKIFVNSTSIPNLNFSANLYIYNLTFNDPKLKMNGVECPASICTINSYSGGTLNFTVAHFTEFEVEERSSSGSSVGGDSGGGGGSGRISYVETIVEDDFSINKDALSVSLKQGQTKSEQIKITNTGTQKRIFTINNSRIGNFIIFNETIFELNPGESKVVDIDFIARETTIPELYLGKVIIKSGNIEKEISVVIDVNAIKALFDLKLEIPPEFLKVNPGKKTLANIQIFNLGETGRIKTEIFYIIKDIDGNILLMEDEIIAVETQKSFVKEIKIPTSVTPGHYILQVKTNYNGEVTSNSAGFDVVSVEEISWQNTLLIILIIILLVLIVSIAFTLREKR